jgi:Cu/Ag efflux protein CusF
MNKTLSTLLAALALGAFGAAHATPNADGEVRKVDKANGKLTMKHGEIKNLDMPPMTMVFTVKDKALLKDVKAGDKVRFSAESVDGQLVVTEIEAQK